jgi:hypothetical protein
MDIKKISRTIAMAAFFGATLYAIVYLLAINSDGFEFMEQKIRTSEVVKEQVGDIKKVRPSLLGPYDQKTVGSEEWVSMTIGVSGTAKAIELDVKAKKTNDVWVLVTVKKGDQSLNLN